MLRPSTAPSGWVCARRRASQASACERETGSGTSGFEDRAEDGETTLPDLDRVLLHRVIDGTHLLDLEVPYELPSRAVEPEEDDAVDEEPLVPEELTVSVRAPFHDDERREVVVPQHLEEVEHALPHVVRVLHEGVQRAEGVEGEDLELVSVDLPIVSNHPLDERKIVRLVLRAHDRVNLPEVREVANLHVHGEFDTERLHVPQVRLHRFLKRRVQPELARVLEVAGHERVAEGRLHRPGRAGDEHDLRRSDLRADHLVESINRSAKAHGLADANCTGARLT